MSNRTDVYKLLAEKELSSVWPQWEISRLIGRGGFADVYEIVKKEYGQVYKSALKIIRLEGSAKITSSFNYSSSSNNDGFSPQKIVSEINIMEQLKGAPNVVVIEDHAVHCEDEEYTILIRMELLENLHSYINRKGSLSQEEIIKLGIDICQALSYCEKKGIIHRDIKADNIFYSPLGDFKLGDFGISRQLENYYNDKAVTRIGTLYYAAPEIYHGKQYDASVDIYSLGLVLYILLNNNRYPFCSGDLFSTLSADVNRANGMRLQNLPLPLPSNAPEVLGAIICKACNPDPEKRYKSANEFKDILENYNKKYCKTDSNENRREEKNCKKEDNQNERKNNTVKKESITGPGREKSKNTSDDIHENKSDNIEQKHISASLKIILAIFAVILGYALFNTFSGDNRDTRIAADTSYTGDTGDTNNESVSSTPDGAFDYYFSEDYVNVGGCYVHPCVFSEELRACKKITVGYKLYETERDVLGTFVCWGRCQGEWVQIDTFELYYSEVEVICTFNFNPPCDIDAITITPAAEVEDEDEEVRWEDEYTFYEVVCENETLMPDEGHSHKWNEATCTKPKTCSICGVTEGESLGHNWQDATYDSPKTCDRCGKTEGNVKGYIDSDQLFDSDMSSEPYEFGEYEVYPWVFNKPLKKCRKIKMGYTVYPSKGDPTGTYVLWVFSDGQWKKIDTISITEPEKEYVKEYIIEPALDIDAFYLENSSDVGDETLEWSFSVTFYEAQVE